MKLDIYTGKAVYRGWPKGVDNRAPDHAVPDNALRDAVNVNVRTSGKVKSRSGLEQAIASPGAHSVFSDGAQMLWATATALYRCGADLAPELLLTDSRLADPISCVAVNGDIYWSNEAINGKVTAAGAYEPWGIEVPTTAPVAAGTTAGTLPRLYDVTCTFVTASGEESGAGPVVSVLCGDEPTIRLTGIPQSSDSRVVATRVYVTNVDGKVYYRNTDVSAGQTAVTLSGFFANGAPLRTQFNSPPPPGQLLAYLNGTIYIASGSTVWYTEALRYGVHDNVGNFFMHPERVTLLAAVPDGLYISSDQTYFYSNVGTEDVRRRAVLPYRAVEGAVTELPDTKDVMWFSDRGFVRGTLGGQVKNLTEDQLAVGKYGRGAMGFDITDGHQSVIALLSDPVEDAAQSPDYTAGEASRAAEVL